MEAKDFVVGKTYRLIEASQSSCFKVGEELVYRGECESRVSGRFSLAGQHNACIMQYSRFAPIEPDYPVLATIERKDLPDDVKARAKAAAIRIIETGEARCINGCKQASTLEGFCTWSATKEGGGFWCMICSAPDKPIAAMVLYESKDAKKHVASLIKDVNGGVADFHEGVTISDGRIVRSMEVKINNQPVKSLTAPEGSIVMIGARPVLTYAAIPHDTVTQEETAKAARVDEERRRYESR